MKDDLEKRADVIAAQLRDEHTFESAIDVLALHMVYLEHYESLFEKMEVAACLLYEKAKSSAMDTVRVANLGLDAVRVARLSAEREISRRKESSVKARKAASVRHEKPGGSKEKRETIRAIWASGKYTSRTTCAEQECAALDMSFDTARRALRNMPNPS